MYKLSKAHILFGLLFALLAKFSCAQVNDSVAVDTAASQLLIQHTDKLIGFKIIDLERDLDEQLIPLVSIIEVALQNHPMVNFQEENILASEAQLAFSRREWSQNVSASANYFYGSQNQLTIASGAANSGAIIGNGLRYGVTVTLPLFELVARKKRNSIYAHQTESYRYKKEEIENEVSRQVILEYARLISNQRSLKIQSATREQARIQMFNAEKDFKSGNIGVVEYTRLTDFYTKAELDYEFWRKEFYSSFYQFEVLVGVKLKDLLQKK